VIRVQISADDVISTKTHKRSSGSRELTGLVRMFTQEPPVGSLKSRRKAKAECNMNSVGANVEKIEQLHMRNSLFYLRNKHEVKAAGESLFSAV